jgi:hypothetical protein
MRERQAPPLSRITYHASRTRKHAATSHLHGVVLCLLPAGFWKHSHALFQSDASVIEVRFQD